MIPLQDTTASTVVSAFLHRWVALYGSPETITTDRGQQFESSVFSAMCQFLGAKRIRTTAYHPTSNGMIERVHRQLKAALMCAPDPGDWYNNLPMVLLGIRAVVKEDLQTSPFELVYGSSPRLPGQLVSPAPWKASESVNDLIDGIRSFLHNHPPIAPRLQTVTS